LSGKPTIYHLTDLKACYDRQLAEVGGILEESVGRDRDALKLISKVIPNWNHYVSTAYGISEKCYRGEDNQLAGTGQGNKFSGDVCRDTSCLIMKSIENEQLGMEFVSGLTNEMIQIVAVMFVDDADMITEGVEAKMKMMRILKMYDDLHSVTGGKIEENKCKFFTWVYVWKQGRREIKNVVVEIEVNGIKVQQVDYKQSERSLGVHISPALVWDKQFEKMKEKMIEAVFKLKNTKIVVPTAHLYYNMYLIKKVYFGCRIVHLTEQQEGVLKRICEPVLLKKLGLSENFPRSVLYSRKTALGVGLLAPRIIIDALALKLYLGHKRANDRIAKVT